MLPRRRRPQRRAPGPTDLFIERTLKWDADLERKVAALNVAQVNAALRKYVSVDKVSIFKAGDFARSN